MKNMRNIRGFLSLAVVMCAVFVTFPGHSEPTEQRTLASAEVLPKILKLVQRHYVAPDLADPQAMRQGALDEVQRTVPEILATTKEDTLTLTVDQATRKFELPQAKSLSDLWDQLHGLFEYIDANYHGDTKIADLEYAAVDGALNVLDPHSNLLRPREYQEFKVGTKGNFGGIGIVIGIRDGRLTVISPIDGTPAARAGIKAMDRIMQIGADSTVNMSLTEAVERLRGRVGTAVVLTVARDNRPQFAVALKRDIIRIDSVQSTTFAAGTRTIGYMKAKTFQENTMSDFRVQLQQLHEQAKGELSGLILDLRNNPGGLLQQAVEMADLFLRDGVIVSTVGAYGRSLEEDLASGRGSETAYPLVILVNEGSASASEIVAGALQAQGRALVIGNRTFGKGSVQTIYNLSDGSALKLTIAEYLTAGKHSIQEIGITPDIALAPVTVDREQLNLLADKRYSESDLEKHLKRRALEQKEATHVVGYLKPPEKLDDPEASKETYSNTLDLKDDFAVNFARHLFEALPDRSMGLWTAVAPVIHNTQREQRKALTEALAQLGVDWSTGKTKGRPTLQITYHLQKAGKPIAVVTAGDDVEIVLTAKNTGSGPLYQLIGQTKSKDGLFANKEFLYGKLGPGEERRWATKLTAAKHLMSEQIPLDVEFQAAQMTRLPRFTAMLPIDGLPRPQFALKYSVGTPARTRKGLPMGTSIPIRVQVKNIGAGTSPAALVSFKNPNGSGPFIEVGRVELGELLPGQSRNATVKFHLDPQFQDKTFSMELAVTDTELFESLANKLVFTVANGAVNPAPDLWYQGPTFALTAATVPAQTKGSEQALTFATHDDDQVKDVFIFVGNQKVFYQSNPQQVNALDIAAMLPLKAGNNIVTIAARDNHDLVTRLTYNIFRKTDQVALGTAPTPVVQ